MKTIIIREHSLANVTEMRALEMRARATDLRHQLGLLSPDEVLAKWASGADEQAMADMSARLRAAAIRQRLFSSYSLKKATA